MTLDFAKVAGLLQRLPEPLRPTGALQAMSLDAPFEPNPLVPTLILGNGGAELSDTVRRTLGNDQAVWLLPNGGPAVAARLDASVSGQLEAIYIPAVQPEAAERSLAGLRQLVHRLRAPGGCPWDRKQTHQSLTKYVLEEAYEVVDAIEHGGPAEMAEELGDLLLQVFLQSEIAEEAGTFTLNDVVQHLTTKLIRRHPHVFADVQVGGAADVEVNWEALKKAEKAERGQTDAPASVLDGIPRSLPGLALAAEVQKRMRKTGFEWPSRDGVEAKLVEELAELRDAATPEEAAAELGDVLFVLTGLATWHGATAEAALRGTVAKVGARFRYLEGQVRARGLEIGEVPLDELVALWNQAKAFDRLPA